MALVDKCGGCQQIIPDRQFLVCVDCNKHYDLTCANVSEKRFYNTMTPERKKKWVCVKCYCNIQKTDNPNTPICQPKRIQNALLSVTCDELTLTPSPLSHVTTRRKTKTKFDIDQEEDYIDDDNSGSIIGDTQVKAPVTQVATPSFPMTMQQWEDIINKKIYQIKEEIVSEIRAYILTDIKTCITDIKNNIQNTTEGFVSEQTTIKHNLNKKIENLEAENNQLVAETKEIQYQITKIINNNVTKNTTLNDTEINKKFVIYGLDETPWEDQQELYNRVVNVFQNILNINIDGLVEDAHRIGRGKRKPVMIELLSKNVTKTVLQNSHYFQGTGLAISEFLNEESLRTRKSMIELLIKARRDGYRANIINNKLYINGMEYTGPYKSNEEQLNNAPIQPRTPYHQEHLQNSNNNFRH